MKNFKSCKTAYYKNIFAVILSLLTSFVFVIADKCKFSFDNFVYSNVNITEAVLYILLFFVFKHFFDRTKHGAVINILSISFAFLSITLQEYVSFFSIGNLFSSKVKILFYCLAIICYFAMFKSLLNIFFNKLEKVLTNKTNSLKLKKWQCGGIIFLLWIPFYIMVFPGTIQWDSVTMLQIAYGLKPLSNDNPILQTGILWLYSRVGILLGNDTVSIVLLVLSQMMALAYMFGAIIYRMIKTAIPKLIVIISFIFIGFLPVFPSYATSLGKDAIFAIPILAIGILLYDFASTPEEFINNKANIFKVFITVLFLCLLRNVGLFVSLIALTPFFIYALIKYKVKVLPLLLAFILAIVSNLAIINLLLPKLNIKEETKAANLSIPLQQIARTIKYNGKGVLNNEELTNLNNVMDIEAAIKVYNREISDDVKNTFNTKATKQQLNKFWQSWQSLGKRYTKEYIAATIYNSIGYFVPGITTTVKPMFFWNYTSIDDIKSSFKIIPHNALKEFAHYATSVIQRIPPFNIIISTGFAQWFNITCLLIVIATKKYKYIFALLPAITVGLGLVASPVNAYFRYIIPAYFSMVLSSTVALNVLKIEIVEKIKTK